MNYANITFKDPNIVKRWLQYKRLETAMHLSGNYCNPIEKYSICDFGAGNGELCKLLSNKYKNALITCYEPTLELYNEAKQNLLNYKINIINNTNNIPNDTFDIIFCLEVFEHLPSLEMNEVWDCFLKILKPNGIIIIGIPIEIGIPALYKGIFRILRRYGVYDANVKNILTSFLGRPPKTRPITEISPGFNWYSPHMGFDYRDFKRKCKLNFNIIKTSASPFNIFGAFFMPELNIVINK